MNPRQNHLLELKRAGIRALDFEAFFELFGHGGSRRAREIYAALRPALARPRALWDREIRLFEPEPARGRSFYYGGTPVSSPSRSRAGSATARAWASVERLLRRADARRAARIYRPSCASGCSASGCFGSWAAPA